MDDKLFLLFEPVGISDRLNSLTSFIKSMLSFIMFLSYDELLSLSILILLVGVVAISGTLYFLNS